MITALSIKIPEKRSGIKGILDKLKRDKVTVEIKRERGVSVKSVTYTSYSGELRLDKTDKLIGRQRDRLLCSEKLIFPRESGYKRFSSIKFNSRLCVNMALSALAEAENTKTVNVGIYDPSGNGGDCVYHLLRYCSNVTVVTRNPEAYSPYSKLAMDELGAAAPVTKNTDALENCGLVVAPCRIEEVIPVKRDTVILTAGKPAVALNAEPYSRFYIRLPEGFDKIKPRSLDDTYFCSALYTLAGQYELGSIVPTSCDNGVDSQTAKSLAVLLDN